MWLIMPVIQTDKETQYHVGYFDSGSFVTAGEPYRTLGDAMAAVHYLNGGMDRSQTDQLINVLRKIHDELQQIRANVRNIR